jgi:hypothetical protein
MREKDFKKRKKVFYKIKKWFYQLTFRDVKNISKICGNFIFEILTVFLIFLFIFIIPAIFY